MDDFDRAVGNEWWVTSGLKAGEQVVVEGGQKTPVGTEVTVQASETTDSTARTAPATAGKEG